ncbi:MAG: four helix bundle protein [Caldilineae bacterium]|nr:MAG: four helix bundle protein [Caldilineae bacterium]
MATFRRFEDIEAWQKARSLTQAVYAISKNGAFARDFGLRDQICRASVSIMSNIAEGFERDGNREFLQFLTVAKGSAGEVRSQLYVAFDQGYIDEATFDKLMTSVLEISKTISGLMRYLQQTSLKGTKYK